MGYVRDESDERGTGKYQDSEGTLRRGRDDRDGSIRHDRFTYDKSDGSKHTHDWVKIDPVDGKEKEGSVGPNAPRKEK
jgi:hypothetical protein